MVGGMLCKSDKPSIIIIIQDNDDTIPARFSITILLPYSVFNSPIYLVVWFSTSERTAGSGRLGPAWANQVSTCTHFIDLF